MSTILPALILLLFTGSGMHNEQDDRKTRIIYVFDPLCGWCFGFAPVITDMVDKHEQHFHFEIISGGMITGNREGPIRSMSDYILNAIPRLEATTGVSIGQPYVDLVRDGSYHASSVMPSKALVVFKHLSNNYHFRFAHDIQKAMFVQGKSLNQMATYLEILKQYPINPDEFIACMNDDAFHQRTLDEFRQAASMGATAYPTLIVKEQNNLNVLSRGYITSVELENRLKKLK